MNNSTNLNFKQAKEIMRKCLRLSKSNPSTHCFGYVVAMQLCSKIKMHKFAKVV